MQGKAENSRPPGSFHRLFSSKIMGVLFGRREKDTNVTHRPLRLNTIEVPIEDPSTNAEKPNSSSSKPHPDASLSSEVIVEFRHIDELEKSNHFNHDVPKEDGLDRILLQKGVGRQNGKNREKTVQNFIKVNQKKLDLHPGRRPTPPKPDEQGPGKAEERKKSNEKERIIGSNQETVANQAEETETETRPPGRPSPPLTRVISNIDEKSETFLRSRKEAMRRNYSLEHENH